MTIWRIPTAGGLKCMSATGAMTMMGQTVATRTVNCPCPTCDTPPEGSLVANILDNGTYLSTGYTPVSVGGSLALKCGLGYTANGSSFSCVYSTPYMGVFDTPLPVCKPLVTTTTTEAPATTTAPAGPSTVGPTTTLIKNVTTYTIKSALTLALDLPENVTAASLAADTQFVSNLAASISAGLGVDVSKVTVTNILLLMRRLNEAQARQLAGAKLKVEYELVTTDPAEATMVEEPLADPTKAASFASAFSTALVEKEAASGRAITVSEIVPEKAVVTSVTEQVVVTQPPAVSDPAPS